MTIAALNVDHRQLRAVPPSPVRFVTGAEFVSRPVPDAEPIAVDAAGSTVIAASGFELTFGDGGAGKTTLWLDGAVHLAAGLPWLGGMVTPTRSLRIGWVENEGPQEEFRRKLERKFTAWGDRIPEGHFRILDRPWGALDLRVPEHRRGIADNVREHKLDLLIVGPLNDLGMEGGGTPDEVRVFHGFLKEIQTLAGRAISLMVLHHENVAGRISGAWTGRPELLIHVTAMGNGKTRLLWQKAKWSSALHRTTTYLAWTETEGFEVEEKGPERPEKVWDAIVAYVRAHGGCSWNDVEAHVRGEATYKRRRRDALLEDKVIVNAGTGRTFKLWHRDDPERPRDLEEEVRRTADAPADAPASPPGSAGSAVGASVRRIYRDDAPTDDALPDPGSAPESDGDEVAS